MKKQFNLTLTTAIATSLVACGPSPSSSGSWDDYTQYSDRDTAVCVDRRTNQRIADSNCDRNGSGGNAAFWYYMGRYSAVPYYGERVSGGTFTRSPNVSYYRAPPTTSMSRSDAISRGGFGSTGRSGYFSSGG